MGILPTVKIVGPKGTPLVINKSEYNPNIDTLVHKKPVEQKKPPAKRGRPPGKVKKQ